MAVLNRRQPGGNRRREFERLARRYQRDIFNAARRLTNSLSDAEDVAQEALIKAYISFDQFESGTNFRAWMLKVVATTHISQVRKELRQPRTITWEADQGEGSPPRPWHKSDEPAPEAMVLNQQLDEPVQEALEQVPEEFRSAIILCDILGLSYREVSEVLKVPLGTVRSRICRGRRILAAHLKEYAEKHGYL